MFFDRSVRSHGQLGDGTLDFRGDGKAAALRYIIAVVVILLPLLLLFVFYFVLPDSCSWMIFGAQN